MFDSQRYPLTFVCSSINYVLFKNRLFSIDYFFPVKVNLYLRNNGENCEN